MSILVVPELDEEPWPTLGPAICDLIEERAVFGPGSLKGQPARLDDEKRAAIWRMYEVYPKGHPFAGRRRFKRVAVSWRKGTAKALALDTPIPTPSGWTTMGELRVGDQVFDETGAVRNVVAMSEVFLDHDCYNVRFRDGSSIVADAGHRWYTEHMVRDGYRGSVKTTEQIAATLTRKDGARNHRIPVAGPLELPEVELPIDPWVLGAWLGDGTTADAEFCMHRDDHPEFLAHIERAGYFAGEPMVDPRTGVFDVRVSTSPIKARGEARTGHSLKGALRDLGVLGNKHVPTLYLRASRAQRLALLQGLMDTDGTIDKSGGSSFVSTLLVLAESVHELMCSLGLKPSLRPAKSKTGKPAWVVTAYADADTPIFSLARKRARQKPPVKRTAMSSNRHIVAVDKVPSVPTKCISVDSPSHLFLAGEAMVPTHNTEWAAWIAFCELHPDGPVRFDGWDAYGNPVGRPVSDPYIPMVAYTEEQTEELAYGALKLVCEEGPDADLFDSGLDRIIRLDVRGRADGKAVALAGSPNGNDGARTTFQHFDETHRMSLPRLVNAHETMLGNIPKRPMDDPWSLETTTAGEPGAGSVAEKTHREAEDIAAGKIEEPDLYYMHREASQGYDLTKLSERIKAVAEATGPAGEYGPGQFRDIAKQWDRPGADKNYLERVWLNRWVRAGSQAFDVPKFITLGPQLVKRETRASRTIPPGSLVTAGFDGARFRDSTAIVLTEVPTGLQNLWQLWERPEDWNEDKAGPWEIDEAAVTASVTEMFTRYKVAKMYCDPPHWTETVGSWESKWPDKVEEWWTNRPRPMAEAIRAYVEAIGSGQVTHDGDEDLLRHIAAAGRQEVKIVDDAGRPLFILQKQRLDRKFDAAMAAVLSWKARLDVYKGAAAPDEFVPRRIR